jgi:WD40 repeat protein/serine/threonine protein kinase
MSDSSRDYSRFDELAQEFVERYRRGERPSLDEYVARLPEMADEIREMFPALVQVEQVEEDARDEALQPPRAVPRLRQIGDFRILREVGHGGMGVVYEAEQISLGRRVALKILPGHVARDRKALERFHREAKAAARLHHTNIVPVFEVGQEGDVAFYAMQFIQGQGLDQVIAELGRLRGRNRQSPGLSSAKSVHIGKPDAGIETRSMRAAGSPNGMLEHVARSLLTGRLMSESLNSTTGIAPTATVAKQSNAFGQDVTLGGEPGNAGRNQFESRPVSDESSSVVLPGGTALSMVESSGRRQPFFRSVAQIGRQAAQGLAYAHARGIVHRDIKPSNLLLDTEGVVWIADFGLAKGEDEGLTQTGDILGTLRYMAPERFRGEGDARADVYALGLTLYELLTLRPGFESPDRLKLIERIKTEEPTTPRSLDGRIPRDLETIVLKAIEKHPKARYQTAEAMGEDLRRFLADEAILARRQTQWERYVRWARHHPDIAVLGGVLTAVLVLATVASLLAALHFQRQEQTQKQLAANNLTLADQREAASRLANARADEIQQNLYWAEMNLAVQAAEMDRGIGRLNELLDHWRPTPGEVDRRGWEWYYMRGVGQQALLSWPHRHTGQAGVSGLSWNPDSRRLASGGEDGVIRLWDGSTGRILATLRGHDATVHCLSWSPHGRLLASGSKTIKIWDVDTRREVATLNGHTGGIGSVSWSPDGSRLASSALQGKVGEVKLWDAATGREIASQSLNSPSPGERAALSWCPDSHQFASASRDGTVRILDGGTGRQLLAFPGNSSYLNAVSWSPDGRHLAGGGDGRTVAIWDPNTGRETASLHGHASGITALAWSTDSRYLASASHDQTLKIWDPNSGRVVANLRGHRLSVWSASWSPDGRRLASGGYDSLLMVWDMASGLRAAPLRGHQDAAWCVCWSPDGRRLASSSLDHTVRIWDAAAGREIQTLRGHTNWVEGLSWSPDGRRLASASHDRTVKLWDADTGSEMATLRGHSDSVTAVMWSHDGRRLVGGGFDGAIKIWAADTGQEIASTPPNNTVIWAVSWNPNGRWVASADINGTAHVMDAETLREIATLRGTDQELKAICWNPDSRRLACGGLDNCVRIWDVPTRQITATLRGHSDWVMGVSWSPDGHRLASGSSDGTIRIWDPDTGQETATLRGHEDRVNAVSWDPDGQRLASTSWDKTIRIWDATRGYTAERSPALLPILERRLAVRPQKPEDLQLRAEIHARLGRWDEAASDWTRAAHFRGAGAPQLLPAGWWVLGPIATPAPPSAETDVEPDPFQPVGNGTPGASNATGLHWRAVTASPGGALDLSALFPNARSGSARALLRVYAPREQPVTARLGSNSNYRFWLNGRPVRVASSEHPRDGDDERMPLTFRAGWNTLLFHVTIGTNRDWLSLDFE